MPSLSRPPNLASTPPCVSATPTSRNWGHRNCKQELGVRSFIITFELQRPRAILIAAFSKTRHSTRISRRLCSKHRTLSRLWLIILKTAFTRKCLNDHQARVMAAGPRCRSRTHADILKGNALGDSHVSQLAVWLPKDIHGSRSFVLSRAESKIPRPR